MTRPSFAASSWRNALLLMRPGQWPILSAQFMLAALLVSPRAAGGGCWLNLGSLTVLAAGWLVWVVMLNGGTLAFNSAHDRDSGPVAYLETPPPPPVWLGPGALALMVLGCLLAWLVVGQALALVTGVCVVLSVTYSAPPLRLKGKPGLDLLINMVGYGAGTTLAGLLVGLAAYLGGPPGTCPTTPGALLSWPQVSWPASHGGLAEQLTAALGGGRLWLVLGFAALFGSLYPGTQIYQCREDRQRGDRTLTTALGVRGALVLALLLGVMAWGFFLVSLQEGAAPVLGWQGGLLCGALLAWNGHQAWWLSRVGAMADPEHEKAMYRALRLWALVDVAVLVVWILG